MNGYVAAYWKILLMIGIVSYFLACSPVQFGKIPAPACQGSGMVCLTACNERGCFDEFEDEKFVGSGTVDILIVNDNSGSMSTEQHAMGDKFPNFIQSLGGVDYRIAITTTDVSSNISNTKDNYPSAVNQQGKLQDGALIEFAPSVPYLTRSTSDAVNLFRNSVQRSETIKCEQSGYHPLQCPSGDERGIFAANLVLDRNDHGFLRPAAPLAIIFLADEDVRSGVYRGGPRNHDGRISGFDLMDYDKPETLVSRFKARYPNKTLSVHSIVVTNGDTVCKAEQDSQGNGNTNVFGSFGLLYSELSQLTGGIIGSVCSKDYGKELGQIGYAIQNQVTSMAFACLPVDHDGDGDLFDVEFTPKLTQNVTATADLDRLVVEFNKPLPPETKVTLKYACEKLRD